MSGFPREVHLLHELTVQFIELEGIMRILIATDGSPSGDKAAEMVCRLASKWKDVSIRVLSVYEAQVPMATVGYAVSSDYYAQLDTISRDRASNIAAKCSSSMRDGLTGNPVELEAVSAMGSPAGAIIQNAEDWGADMIVVGSHGHGFWGRVTLGSVADRVLHHASCSVMVVK